jgi:hypothetical protein
MKISQIKSSVMRRKERTVPLITRVLLVALISSSVPVLADTLAGGSIYFDSQTTLEEVVKLSAQKDNESILKLINGGHVTQQTDSESGIVVLRAGSTPESPAEFRFASGPTTYWTLTKFVTKDEAVEPTPAPAPEPSATPMAKRPRRKSEDNDPLDDDNGRRVWHRVDGKWKWYPVNKKQARKEPAPDTAPAATPNQ